jgi:hypothetical protein
MAIPPNIRASLTAALTLALGACSSVPDARWPERHTGEVELVYRFVEGAPRIFRMPTSDDALTLLWLEADPVGGITERFVDGQRIWIAPDELDELRVRCRYRLFDAGDARGATVPPIAGRFPGGELVQHRFLP